MTSEKPTSQRAWRAGADFWTGAKDAARDQHGQSTPAEARLWRALRGRHLGGARFRRQHAIGHYLVDFYCADARLVVEVDGEIHRLQSDRDLKRQRALQDHGFNVIRFKNDEILQDLPGVLRLLPFTSPLTPLRLRRGGPTFLRRRRWLTNTSPR
ncbi:MAG TPA: endonuclease domain-containing protein [Dehalococcoidia bacterium]|nr:endonuclease domain-containing protein [Dehalococcoidia bacterium]